MSGPFDFLHIKGRTEGSSNELSFDVLDAARSGMDTQKGSARRVSGSSTFKGSYHGVAGTSTFSAAPEVERRKRARRAHTRRIWLIAVVAVLTLVGTGAFFGYRYYQQTMDFNGHFNLLIEKMVDIDKTLVKADGIMQDPLSALNRDASMESGDAASGEESLLVSDARDLAAQVSGMKRDLNVITAEAREMGDLARTDGERAALSQVEDAAEARESMLLDVEECLSLVKTAGKRVAQTNDIWNRVLTADQTARDAAEKANEARTEEATLEARRLTESARNMFDGAKEDLQALESGEPKIDFKAEKAYIGKRVDSLDAAIKTANALLANNRDGATAANNAYNQADKEAVALAADLPTSESDKVAQAYQGTFKNVVKSYDDNRAAASTADSAIRAYLGNR